jgi:2-polyprenyl-3-methyl-5-hydroxy-6-metoxy-1,4-benzoquinol methylase
MQHYKPSPKVIVISGPRCSGKSYVSRKLANELLFACISQDHVRLEIQEREGLTSEDLFHPKTKNLYKKAFIQRLREVRYADLVVEGARLSQPFILEAFLEALQIEYGEYTITKLFFLDPGMEIRFERYAERIRKHIREFEQEAASRSTGRQRLNTLAGYITSPFDAFSTAPEIFHKVCEPQEVIDWTLAHIDLIHPRYPRRHSRLIETIAKSGSNFSPFYQTVDVGNERVITGQTRSFLTWENISRLGIDWSGKRVCEIGCNNGYFLFKAEALGAQCIGFDISKDSIDAAKEIARYLRSAVDFHVRDVSPGLDAEYDVVLALNMLHYISDLESLLSSMSKKSKSLVLEVGENQIERIFPIVMKNGHRLVQRVESHRKKSVIGDRVILHFQSVEP